MGSIKEGRHWARIVLHYIPTRVELINTEQHVRGIEGGKQAAAVPSS